MIRIYSAVVTYRATKRALRKLHIRGFIIQFQRSSAAYTEQCQTHR